MSDKQPANIFITIRFFAGARECAGIGSLSISLPSGSRIADAIRAAQQQAPRPFSLPENYLVARNGQYSEQHEILTGNDEIAIIPPVSGGADSMPLIIITSKPIAIDPIIDKTRADSDGAVVVFQGVTRNCSQGRQVIKLEYEAYSPMAENTMMEIIDEMQERWDIGSVGVVHRIGRVDVGETSMALVVTAPHRAPAFEASQYFIDRLKQIVPIWKKEYFEGGEVWIGATPG